MSVGNRAYELVLLFDVSFQEQIGQMMERYKAIISESGGSVDHFEDWGKISPAYVMQDHKKIHYFLMNVRCPQKTILELERSFKLNDAIVRHLIVRIESARKQISAGLKNINENKDKHADDFSSFVPPTTEVQR